MESPILQSKISFIGTHGTRKTTAVLKFAAFLKERGVDVGIVTEIARDCPLPINEDTNREAQTWILMQQIAEEIRIASKNKVVVCDRSVLDNYAYLYRSEGRKHIPELWELVKAWIKSYKLLIFVCPDVSLKDDGVRAQSQIFQAEIHEIIDGWLKEDFVGLPVKNVDASKVGAEEFFLSLEI